MIKTTVSAVVAALLLCGGASAATLSASGSVMVNSGSGFRPVAGVVQVNAGDRILVGTGGQARIAYSDSCAMNIAPHRASVVAAKSPCEGRMNGGLKDGPAVADPHAGYDMAGIIGGTIAVGGIAAAIYTVSKNKSSASP